MTHLLDTDHISILERKSGPEYAVLALNLNRHPPDAVGVPVVSYHEQALGCHAKINAARTPAEVIAGYELLARIVDEFRGFPVVPYDSAAAVEFDNLRTVRPQLSVMDRRIAATALSRGLTVVTRNARDFGRVPGLRTDDWTR